jgi:inner membrane protein
MQIKIFLKLLVLGGVSIFMLIALASIGGITNERDMRRFEVQENIAASYAGEQCIVGPVFLMKYRETWMGRLYNKEKERWYEKEMSAFRSRLVFPKRLMYDGSLTVQERYRGIFKAQVFQSKGTIEGNVVFPKEELLHIEKNSSIELVSIKGCLMVKDQRGITESPVFEWKGSPLEILAGSALGPYGSGVHVVLPHPKALLGSDVAFSMNLKVHGMKGFNFVPIGFDNQIRLKSDWPHPSFVGNFLATSRTISEKGFTAEWNVNGLACSAQQNMTEGDFRNLQQLGVDLIDPVNPYPMTDRALKYGFLFIFITFAAFFLFELVKQLKIHPIQYGFVGLAQALFFLLLLSLSEHIGFGWSYLIATIATIGVLFLYLCSILKSVLHGALFGGVLALLYGALYGLLQSEDHALVAGSTLLFGLTAFVMILTRKIDWYALTSKPKTKS